MEVLWQCGKYYKESVDRFAAEAGEKMRFIHHSDFIRRMDLAYAMADVVISRSGASSVSELCAAGKAVIFVPSPNVAEDHQTCNAMALVRKDAAMMVTDAEAPEKLMDLIARSFGAIKVRPDQKILIERNLEDYATRVETIKNFVTRLVSLLPNKQ